jgi:hypothetical protein
VKLELLSEGSPDCPLIRLSEFAPAEAGELHAAVVRLATGMADEVDVNSLKGVHPVSDCQLSLTVSRWDRGIVQNAGTARFVCGFTRPAWENVSGLIEPFARGAAGYQWLAGLPGNVALLLSVDGHW